MRLRICGLCLLLVACGGSHQVMISRRSAASGPPVPAPLPPTRPADSSRAGELVRQSIVGPLRSLFRSSRHAEAFNVTSADEVADDAWFVSRVRDRMASQDAAADAPPDTSAPWTVVSWRRVNALPVLTIRDAMGREYWLTFDAPEFPELATTVEIVTAQLYRAAGYHVPTVALLRFDPARRLAVPSDSLRSALAERPRDGAGRIRAAAHHLPGQALGAFSFSGHRADDPADSIPHEQRRELRGLYVVAAWLNHTGLFRGTTLDVGIDGGTPAVRHYLLGLETALDVGAGGRPKLARTGHEAVWDAGKIAGRLLTLGFFAVPWERDGAAEFDPGHWTPSVPNSAFAHRTTRDGYWGAQRVGGISNQQIAAAVWAAEPSDSTRARALIQMLQARRLATIRYWYSRVTPLAELAISHTEQNPMLEFRDLMVGEGLAAATGRTYDMRASWLSGTTERAHLASDGRGTLRLPRWNGCSERLFAGLSVENRVGWIDIRAESETRLRPRALRLFVLCESKRAEYRLVGWRY
ncbi:MAG TPA: hypothetical protein VGJ80_12975 [Gemmatimonadales bacterium]|jgi:hypothetical protein